MRKHKLKRRVARFMELIIITSKGKVFGLFNRSVPSIARAILQVFVSLLISTHFTRILRIFY